MQTTCLLILLSFLGMEVPSLTMSSAAMYYHLQINLPTITWLKKQNENFRIEELQRTMQEFEFPFLYLKKEKGKKRKKRIVPGSGASLRFLSNKCLKKIKEQGQEHSGRKKRGTKKRGERRKK